MFVEQKPEALSLWYERGQISFVEYRHQGGHLTVESTCQPENRFDIRNM